MIILFCRKSSCIDWPVGTAVLAGKGIFDFPQPGQAAGSG